MKIALVTDSTCDIPGPLAEELEIHVVPNLVVIDGKSYEDGKGMSREEFYTRLAGMKNSPTTATASSGTYGELYAHLLELGHEAVVSIHPASRLSGIINAATAAANDFGRRVCVVDSETLSLGMGFQVIAAAEAVRRGMHLDELLELLKDVRRRVRLFAMLDTLEYVRRSGRVSWARARLGNLLQIKPFIEVVENGQVNSLGETRTRTKGIQRLHQLLKSMGELERLAILHTNAEADARQFLADAAPQTSYKPLIVNVTTVIGTHVGPNGLGFTLVRR